MTMDTTIPNKILINLIQEHTIKLVFFQKHKDVLIQVN